ERQSAHALRRKEFGQQASVQEIDGKRAARDVGAALALIAIEQVSTADVAVMLVCFDNKLGDAGRVTQPKIKPLSADRRHHMGCFADQRDAIARYGFGNLDRKREQPTSRFNGQLAEERMRSPFDLSR